MFNIFADGLEETRCLLIKFSDGTKLRGHPQLIYMRAAVLQGESEGPGLVQLGDGMALGITNSSTPVPTARFPRRRSYNSPRQEGKR